MSAASVVLPGDEIDLERLEISPDELILGPGLQRGEDVDVVEAIKAGTLKHDKKLAWVDNKQKRYVAAKGDSVLGVVTAKLGDSFRVDIGSASLASLSFLSFEGSTKKNRPDVKVGDVVYGKLLVANRYMEPELVCIDSFGKANGMGVIRGNGNLLKLNLQWTRRMLSKDCSLLKNLGSHLPFEVTVGVNGRVWIMGRSVLETLIICDIVKSGEIIPNSVMPSYVTATVNKVIKTKQ